MYRITRRARPLLTLELLVFVGCPIALVTLFTLGTIHHHFAWDFRVFWHAGRAVSQGHSPYPASVVGGGPWADGSGVFVYPAPSALAMVPLGILPFGVAAALYTLVTLASVPLALWFLRVRDWRCYGTVFLWLPVLSAVRLGALTPLLLLGIAICWRLRERGSQPRALAAAVVAKVFLWPLLVWNASAGRLLRTLVSVTLIAGGALGSWAVIGFAGFGDYPRLLHDSERLWGGEGYSLPAAERAFGLSWRATNLILFAVGLALALAIAYLARRQDDRSAFVLAVGAALLLSPVAWLHYSMLLAAVIAVSKPRLGLVWFLPLAFWATPHQSSSSEPWRIGLALFVILATVVLGLRQSRRQVDEPILSQPILAQVSSAPT